MTWQKTTLVGRLGKDPQRSFTQSGAPCTELDVAVDDEHAKLKTVWIEVIAWDRIAESIGEDWKKASLVLIEGVLEQKEWTERRTNITRHRLRVRALKAQRLDRMPSRAELDRQQAELPLGGGR